MMSKKNNLLSWIVLSSLTFVLISCGTVMKTLVGLPALNVYTQEEIEQNINELPSKNNVVDLTLNDIPNKEVIEDFIYKSIAYRAYVYDYKNRLMCFNGSTSCSIDELSDLRENTIETNYKVCDSSNLANDKMNLAYILNQLNHHNIRSLLDSKYKVLVFMNTDIAKGEIKNEWEYIYNSFQQDNSENIKFLRVWTDLNENWGFRPNGKAKFKMKKVKNSKKEYTITLKSLPYKD